MRHFLCDIPFAYAIHTCMVVAVPKLLKESGMLSRELVPYGVWVGCGGGCGGVGWWWRVRVHAYSLKLRGILKGCCRVIGTLKIGSGSAKVIHTQIAADVGVFGKPFLLMFSCPPRAHKGRPVKVKCWTIFIDPRTNCHKLTPPPHQLSECPLKLTPLKLLF